jgi:glycosyltransferase involved in cell wall biosynthesis
MPLSPDPTEPMRVLLLSKRRPQGRCLLERPYGRFVHLPIELARIGHEVDVALVGHAGDPPAQVQRDGVRWHSMDLRRQGWFGVKRELVDLARSRKTQWLIGCSDAWAGVLASSVAKAAGSKLALDAYDDFESYMPWNLPLHWAWRGALARAEVVTAAGPQLAALLDRHRPGRWPTVVVPMAADPGFVPMPKADCRGRLGLPESAPIVTYAGAWGRERGTNALRDAWPLVGQRAPEALLALSGRPPKSVQSMAGVRTLGYLADELMPVLLNAADVACVISRESRFGLSSYPAKLCEALACGTQVVASATAPVAWMAAGSPTLLAPPEDSARLADSIMAALDHVERPTPIGLTWREAAALLDAALRRSPTH